MTIRLPMDPKTKKAFIVVSAFFALLFGLDDSIRDVLRESSGEPVSVGGDTVSYQVVRVIDGDTVRVLIGGKEETIRLIGINTPETVDPRRPVQCFGKEASEKAKEILSDSHIRIETDPTQGERDKYGRLLGYILLPDGANFNRKMIEEGYAYEYTYGVPYRYQTEFKEAERDAREGRRGFWSEKTCGGEL